MKQKELTTYLDQYLRIDEVKDSGPQGLQVEAEQREVQKIALSVDVSPIVIEAAAEWGANMLLVHHGLFWGSAEKITGALAKRVRALLRHDMHLYAAHLALDAHPVVGNNAVLAALFGLQDIEWWCNVKGTKLGVIGNLAVPISAEQLRQKVDTTLKTEARLLAHGADMVQRLAILSGGGAGYSAETRTLGADTYLTGETSHSYYWAASDYDLNIIYAGHYATETVGVQALGQHLVEQFGVEIKFFDFPTQM